MGRTKAAQQAYDRLKNHRLRMSAIIALGGECAVCGYDDDRALHIDHVHGDGKLDRKMRGGGQSVYRRAVAEAASGRYQILCANCHDLKSHANGERGRPRHKLQDSEPKA